MVRPHMAKSIISGGPNITEMLDSTGAKNSRTTNPMILPIPLAITEKYKALFPSPFLVIWYPSKAVQDASAVPGQLIRIPDMDPP